MGKVVRAALRNLLGDTRSDESERRKPSAVVAVGIEIVLEQSVPAPTGTLERALLAFHFALFRCSNCRRFARGGGDAEYRFERIACCGFGQVGGVDCGSVAQR